MPDRAVFIFGKAGKKSVSVKIGIKRHKRYMIACQTSIFKTHVKG
jgi:hypothetical protein